MHRTVALNSDVRRLLRAVLRGAVRRMLRPRHARKPKLRPRRRGGRRGVGFRRLHELADEWEVKVHFEVLRRLRQSR
jgi:hypothetical protein